MLFYLGVHEPHWAARTAVPLFLSARRLRGRRTLPLPLGRWALDSGGFSELSLYGRWQTPAMQYASEARRFRDGMPGLDWCAPQDWMCEPFIVQKTGLSVREHQRLTVANFLVLRQLAPDLPWAPVLQGWEHDDYLDHVAQYRAAGVDLAAEPLVGLGSVCRRQATSMAEDLIRGLVAEGIRLHGFGFKVRGLARVARHLRSADSMAWSYEARRAPPLTGHRHKNCANCLDYALAWRERLLKVLDRPAQLRLF